MTFLEAFKGISDHLPLVIGIMLLLYIAIHILMLCVRSINEQRQSRLAAKRVEAEVDLLYLKYRKQEEKVVEWKGYRKFEVTRKEYECPGVYSYYLVPHDKRPLITYFPGQYLTFKIQKPGVEKSIVRCYSLSDKPREDYYRVTIKKVPEVVKDDKVIPAGVVSSYFSDDVKEGDILDVAAPKGHFYLDLEKNTPLVLLSAGVGITPMLSMCNTVLQSAAYKEVWFIHGAPNSKEHIQREHLKYIATANPNLHLRCCYSKPLETDVLGRDYHHQGHVNLDALKKLLPSNNYDFYLCGPGAFMAGLVEGLAEWGVPEQNVRYETFGPSSVKKVQTKPAESVVPGLKLSVTFKRSAKSVDWDPSLNNLLEFAKANNVHIDSGCCAGNCGTCLVAIKEGNVEYLEKGGVEPEAGSCLTCVCRPKSNLVIDA